jgi:multiple sugar transport system substrate-binding protein
VLNAAREISGTHRVSREEAGADGDEGGTQGNVYGYVMRAASDNDIVTDFLPIFWAFGADIFDKEWRPTVNSPQGVKALALIAELKKYSPDAARHFRPEDVNAQLSSGKAAQSINWQAWIHAFRDRGKWEPTVKIKFSAMPSQENPGQALIGNWLLAIPRTSPNQREAFEFILWATERKQMERAALRGSPPTRKSIFNDPHFNKIYPSYGEQLRSLEHSRPRPRTARWKEIEEVLGPKLRDATFGNLSPQEALDQANEQLTTLMQGSRQP